MPIQEDLEPGARLSKTRSLPSRPAHAALVGQHPRPPGHGRDARVSPLSADIARLRLASTIRSSWRVGTTAGGSAGPDLADPSTSRQSLSEAGTIRANAVLGPGSQPPSRRFAHFTHGIPVPLILLAGTAGGGVPVCGVLESPGSLSGAVSVSVAGMLKSVPITNRSCPG